MSDITTPLTVEPLLEAFLIHLSSSNPAPFVVVFLLLSFPPYFRLSSESPLSRFAITFPLSRSYCAYQDSVLSIVQSFPTLFHLYDPADFLHFSPCPYFEDLWCFYRLVSHGLCL